MTDITLSGAPVIESDLAFEVKWDALSWRQRLVLVCFCWL